ncbi:hypothetical protein ACP275_13G012500 [Erythranthe tilingii]
MNMFTTFSHVFILVSIILISSTTCTKITDKEIKHLCSKTSNPDRCYKLLKSDHRITNVDAKGLAQISIDLAAKNAKEIHSVLNALVQGTHSARLREMYNRCSKNYNDAIRHLEAAKNNLKSGGVQVADASKDNKQCEEVFRVDHSHMKKKNDDFNFVLSVVKVVVNNLNKK